MAGITLKGEALSKALLTELGSILEEDWSALNSEGDEVESEVTAGDFVTIHVKEGHHGRWTQHYTVVTKTPEGRLYLWSYEYGSGDTENIGPAEYGPPKLLEVREVEEIVIVKNYFAV